MELVNRKTPQQLDTTLDYVKKVGTVEGKLEQRIRFDNVQQAKTKVGIREFATAKGYKVDYDAKTKTILLTKGDLEVRIYIKENRYQTGVASGKFANMPTFENGHYLYLSEDLNAAFSSKVA